MIGQAIQLIVSTVVSFLVTLCLIRFLMQACRISFVGQLGQFVLQITHWLIIPLRRVTPSVRGYDLASLLGAYLLQLAGLGISVLTINSSLLGLLPPESLLLYLLGGALMGLLRLMVYLFIASLIVQAVLSWVNPYSPLARPLHQITSPILDPIRRVIPPIAGVDLSPFVVLLIAQLLLLFL